MSPTLSFRPLKSFNDCITKLVSSMTGIIHSNLSDSTSAHMTCTKCTTRVPYGVVGGGGGKGIGISQ